MKRVTAAIITKEGKVLIARKASHSNLAGFWEFPGGLVEEGETPAECLVRELVEELGIRTIVNGFCCESDYSYPHGSFKIIAYHTEWLGGEIELKEHDQIEFVEPYALKTFQLLPADIAIANHLEALTHKA
jgi:8-oxo-dGTP diphosphatase